MPNALIANESGQPSLKPICQGMWSVTPYARCDIRCHYCCTQVQGKSLPTTESLATLFDSIMALPASDTVILGAFSDAYPNAELEHGLTRRLLERLADAARPVVIVTKGVALRRDLDVLQRFGEAVLVQLSISTMDDEQAVRIEPGAAPSSERLQLLRELHKKNVPVEVNALPWIPGLSDLEALLLALPEGVKVNVSPLATTSEDGSQRLFYQRFERDEVVSAYLAERQRLLDRPQLSWVRPAASGHHDPLNRFRNQAPQAELP
ncbi:MAG: hypothetical protein Hals2KO_28680 [Halioglobus sp.]